MFTLPFLLGNKQQVTRLLSSSLYSQHLCKWGKLGQRDWPRRTSKKALSSYGALKRGPTLTISVPVSSGLQLRHHGWRLGSSLDRRCLWSKQRESQAGHQVGQLCRPTPPTCACLSGKKTIPFMLHHCLAFLAHFLFLLPFLPFPFAEEEWSLVREANPHINFLQPQTVFRMKLQFLAFRIALSGTNSSISPAGMVIPCWAALIPEHHPRYCSPWASGHWFQWNSSLPHVLVEGSSSS